MVRGHTSESFLRGLWRRPAFFRDPLGPGAGAGLAAEIDTSAEFAFVTDFGSGKVLMEKEPDALMKPASMAKIMTVYIAFERIADGGLSLDDTFLISEKAWRKGGSKTFVEVGKEVSVGDLLYGVVVQSGNDAAIAIAEGISGTEDALPRANYVARFGMENTVSAIRQLARSRTAHHGTRSRSPR